MLFPFFLCFWGTFELSWSDFPSRLCGKTQSLTLGCIRLKLNYRMSLMFGLHTVHFSELLLWPVTQSYFSSENRYIMRIKKNQQPHYTLRVAECVSEGVHNGFIEIFSWKKRYSPLLSICYPNLSPFTGPQNRVEQIMKVCISSYLDPE